MAENPTAPFFDRVVFASLVPALLLPVLASIVAVVRSSASPVTDDFGGPIAGLMVSVFMFVLLGSMTLNTWLLLRHPHSLTERVLPRRLSIFAAALIGLILVWILVMVFVGVGTVTFPFALIAIILSIMVFASAAARRFDGTAVDAIDSVELSPLARGLAIGYLVLAALALGYALASSILGGELSGAGSIVGGPAVWVLLLLGLPWSHPLYLLSTVIMLSFAATSAAFGWITTAATVAAVLMNCAIVIALLRSPGTRAGIVNWFFRLRRAGEPSDEEREDAAFDA